MCRSRRGLSNEYLLAKFGVDTAESEPCKVCPLSASPDPPGSRADERRDAERGRAIGGSQRVSAAFRACCDFLSPAHPFQRHSEKKKQGPHAKSWRFLEKKSDLRAVQRSASCRSRRELSNAYLLAQFGFDTAENEHSPKIVEFSISIVMLNSVRRSATGFASVAVSLLK